MTSDFDFNSVRTSFFFSTKVIAQYPWYLLGKLELSLKISELSDIRLVIY